MKDFLFGSDLWEPALDKYAQATGLSVELFGANGERVLASTYLTPLVALFREYGFEPGLFKQCAERCLAQTTARPAVVIAAQHGLTVVGASLLLDGRIVGAAVAGFALGQFSQVPAVQRWAAEAGVPFARLWEIARRQAPLPERRLALHGELLQVLGDALLRENHRTRQHEDTSAALQAAAAAKDEFFAVLSHELRTPLAAIVGWANVLKKSANVEHVQRAAEAIERNAFLQSRMVDDLFDVNRIAQGKVTLDLSTQELQGLVHAAVEASTQEVEKKAIRFEFVDAAEPLQVTGDSGRLQQVFRNIISNAVKFTPQGGSIRITLTRRASYALVVVADSGQGIAAEFLPHVFELFRQQEAGTRREHGGLGIGLALVKRLVEMHQGTVVITSAGAGCGAEVSVRLPLAEATGKVHAEPARDEPVSAVAGLSVLVVEDMADTRDSLRDLLLLLGAKVAAARDGREALDMLAATDPDLVLCDLRMPRMDGFEFMRELNRGDSQMRPPVIAMSGLASEVDRQRTRAAGFRWHIKKPFDEAAIAQAVGAVFGNPQNRRRAERRQER